MLGVQLAYSTGAHDTIVTKLGERHVPGGVRVARPAQTAITDCKSVYQAFGQVGDGAILGLNADETQLDPLRAQLDRIGAHNEPNATHTLATADLERQLAVTVVKTSDHPLAVVFVMTDGVSDDLLYASEGWKAWALGVRSNVLRSATVGEAAAGMLNWLATFKVVGNYDDRTLVVITRKDSGIEAADWEQ